MNPHVDSNQTLMLMPVEHILINILINNTKLNNCMKNKIFPEDLLKIFINFQFPCDPGLID